MILKRIRKVINEFRSRDENRKLENENIKAQLSELEWAHIYHDTIEDKEWLKGLSISPGRWAGNYSFFYVLVRILSDFKPERILEFGLGESSKIISSFLHNELNDSKHLILEQDKKWMEVFKSKYELSVRSNILHLPLTVIRIKDFEVRSYEGIEEAIKENFDLYVVDGPFGSARYSRYQICAIASKLTSNEEFIILLDDYDRQGEQDTASDLIGLLTSKGIKIFTGIYAGNKSQIIIVTEKYRFLTSL